DRDLLTAHGLKRQRIKCADKNGRTRGGQEQVIEHKGALTRDRREQAALLEQRRPQREQRQRAADKQHQDRQNEDAARGIGRESVNRRQHAGANQEGADQRQREGQDRQQDGPDF